jgi:phosphoribosylformylglycinamidine synthase
MTVRARVLIRPKAGILDPQGEVVQRALPVLGFEGVENVHVGRLVELDVADPDQLPQMCERLLVNPLIEDYEIQLSTSEGEAETAGVKDSGNSQRSSIDNPGD